MASLGTGLSEAGMQAEDLLKDSQGIMLYILTVVDNFGRDLFLTRTVDQRFPPSEWIRGSPSEEVPPLDTRVHQLSH